MNPKRVYGIVCFAFAGPLLLMAIVLVVLRWNTMESFEQGVGYAVGASLPAFGAAIVGAWLFQQK